MLDPKTATFNEVYRFMAAWLTRHEALYINQSARWIPPMTNTTEYLALSVEQVFMVLSLLRLVLWKGYYSGTLWAIITGLRGADSPMELATGPSKARTVGRLRRWLNGNTGLDKKAVRGVVYAHTWTRHYSKGRMLSLSHRCDVADVILAGNSHFSSHLETAMLSVEGLCDVKGGDRVPTITQIVRSKYHTNL